MIVIELILLVVGTFWHLEFFWNDSVGVIFAYYKIFGNVVVQIMNTVSKENTAPCLVVKEIATTKQDSAV